MRFSRLSGLLSPRKYKKLRTDFRTPFKALLASSGMSGKTFTLITREGGNHGS